MLKFANVVLEFLLEFGMHYSCIVTSVACLFLVEFFFNEIFYEYKSCLLLLFDSILYCKLYAIYYI
jgi:hypothetical protein